MATVYLSLSTMANGTKKQIMVRFSHGRVNQRAKSGIFIAPENWDPKLQSVIMPRARLMTDAVIALTTELREVDAQIRELKNLIIDTYTSDSDAPSMDNEWLKKIIYKHRHGDEQSNLGYWDTWQLFIESKAVSQKRKAMYANTRNMLQRFEQVKKVKNKYFALSIDTFTPILLAEFDMFIRNEESFVKKYPAVYEKVPLSYVQRGSNTVAGRLSILRAFSNWVVAKDITTNNPFAKYSIKPAVYGTPIYISKEERDKLYATKMSTRSLNVVRDIFVLQCLIGCRVGDYMKMSKDNIVNGAIEYIAGKTADERPMTVRVPLNAKALEILRKYPKCPHNALMPFISQQKYNTYIKECFKEAGLTRIVTVLDPRTGVQKQERICDIASSHMARRVFIGNLYQQVQDPNLIGALSGHREGSKAFARYRDIDEQMKQDLVKLLE